MGEANWNKINTSPPLSSLPIQGNSILHILPKEAFYECVTYFCLERQEKHYALGINQEQFVSDISVRLQFYSNSALTSFPSPSS